MAGLTRTSAGGFAFGGGAPPVGPFGGAPPPNGFIGPGRGTPGGGVGPLPVRGGGGFGGRGGGFGTETSADVSRALAYVASHGAAKRFGLIVTSEQEAAPYLIRGAPIAALGGFTGRETVLTNAYLAALVRSGAARYFLLGGDAGFGPGGSSNAAVTTISSTCRVVTARRWAGSSWSARATLYDCAGKAAALAHPAG